MLVVAVVAHIPLLLLLVEVLAAQAVVVVADLFLVSTILVLQEP